MTDSNYCTGCFSLNRIRSSARLPCIYVERNSKGECPCTLCIVKCMCDEGCPKFDIYVRRMWKN